MFSMLQMLDDSTDYISHDNLTLATHQNMDSSTDV